MKTPLLVYQLEQVPTVAAYLSALPGSERDGLCLVALGADIELALSKAGLSCMSARDLRTMAPIDRLTYAEQVSESIFGDERMRFLTHRTVPYGKIHAHALQRYLDGFLYYADMVQTLVAREAPHEIRVLESHKRGFTGDVLADFLERAVYDAAVLIGGGKGILVTLIPAPNRNTLAQEKLLYHLKRSLYGLLVSLMNLRVLLIERPRPLRLVISDAWGAIKPLLAELPEAEVVLYERTEATTIGWKNIRQHRMRFRHADAYARPAHQAIARKEALTVYRAWDIARRGFPLITEATFNDLPLASIIEKAVGHIINSDAENNIREIEHTFAMLESIRPQVVLVRASGSIQMHYSFLCYVAKALGIPSVELQHGILYLGPGSVASHMSAEFVATYGTLPNTEFMGLGYAPDKLRATGSPRFDTYAGQRSAEVQRDELHICYVLSAIDPGLWLDTYETEELLTTLHQATAGFPNVQVSVAVRSDSPYTPFVQSVIDGLPAGTRVQITTERAMHLMRSCALVIVGHSTVLLEALLLGKPVIHDATPSLYDAIEKGSIIFRGVPVPVARTVTEMRALIERYADSHERELLGNKLQESLKRHYVTDDRASERVAVFIRKLAGTKETVR